MATIYSMSEETTEEVIDAPDTESDDVIESRTPVDPVAILMNLQEKAQIDKVLAAQIEAATWKAAYESERQR